MDTNIGEIRPSVKIMAQQKRIFESSLITFQFFNDPYHTNHIGTGVVQLTAVIFVKIISVG
jgi:hypothetical protein